VSIQLLRNYETAYSTSGLFYVSEEMGLRMGYWFGFAAVAGAFGGLIAYGLQHAHTAVASWRLLFIIEVILPLGEGNII
jgi:MFS family permease